MAIKVLQVIGDLSCGGAQRLVTQIITNNRSGRPFGPRLRSQYEMDLCLFYNNNLLAGQLNGVKIYNLGCRSKYDFTKLFRFMRLIREYDIVHCHLFPQDLFCAIASLFFKKRPVFIYTEHNITNRRRRYKIFYPLDFFIFSRFPRIIACSKKVASALIAYIPKVRSRVITIPNAIEIKSQKKEDRSLEPVPNSLIFVGRLTRQKGIDILIKACALLSAKVRSEWNLTIVGDGEERHTLQNLVTKLNLEKKISFLGNRLDVLSLIAASEIFILPSRWEGLPMVLLEAMALGKPIIATRVGGNEEILSNSSACLLPLKADENELALDIAKTIEELLNNPKKRTELGVAARKRFEEVSDSNAYLRKLLAVYDTIFKFQISNSKFQMSTSEMKNPANLGVIHILGASAFGGGVYYIQTLCQRLRDKGFKVKILAENELVANYFKKDNFPVLTTKSFVREINPIKDISALFRTITILRKERPFYIHTHTSKAGFIGRLAAKIVRIPVIIHTVHGYAFHEYSRAASRLFYSTLERLLLPFTTKIITMNEKDYEWTLGKLKNKTKVSKIYNGISLDEIDALSPSKFQIPNSKFQFIFVGRLCSQKNLTCLLEASAQLKRRDSKNFSLSIIGADGGEEAVLRKRSDELNLNGIINFLGFRSRPETIRLLKSADCFILPSIYEGLSITLLEAGACGLPIIASNIKGNREVIKDGLTGLLFNPKDPEELASKMERVLNSFELRKELGTRVKEDIKKNFSIEKFLTETLKVYG